MIEVLDKKFSTTRRLTKNIPEVLLQKENEKFQSLTFLSPNIQRLYEGGLRTRGYFKFDALDRPLISVITVALNGQKYIEQTIKSVITQGYDNVEYIIIDGGSTDKSLEIIKEYENQIDYVVSEPDKGLYEAFNKGIALSQGSLVWIINADDYLEEGALKIVSDVFLQGYNDVFYGDTWLISYEGQITRKCEPEVISGFEKDMVLSHPSCILTRLVYKKHGLYDDTFKIAADYDLLTRLYVKGCKFKKIDTVLSNFREGGLSSVFSLTHMKEIILVRKKNGFPKRVTREWIIFIYSKLKPLPLLSPLLTILKPLFLKFK